MKRHFENVKQIYLRKLFRLLQAPEVVKPTTSQRLLGYISGLSFRKFFGGGGRQYEQKMKSPQELK